MKRQTRIFTWEEKRKRKSIIDRIKMVLECYYVSVNMPKKKAG